MTLQFRTTQSWKAIGKMLYSNQLWCLESWTVSLSGRDLGVSSNGAATPQSGGNADLL